MRMKLVAGCLVALLFATLSIARADEAVEEIAALKAEPQTASWWTARHERKLTESKKPQRVDLLMIGDSITHGWENSDRREIWDRYYAERNPLNIGFSGDRTEHVLWRFEHGAIDGISPKLAVVMIGTNNTGHRQDDPKHTAAGIKAVVEQLGRRLPKTKVLLLAIFPRGKDPNDKLRKINDATNKIIAGYADGKRVFFLDINDVFLEDNGALPKSIMPDLLHPNKKGYALWAEAMEPMVKKLMGE